MFLAVTALLPLQAKAASERIALIIGNAGYEHVVALDHARDDVLVMADTLRHLDFEVQVAIDQNRQSMQQSLLEFGERIDRAGNQAVGLLFYAGHGFQHDGSNYLMPIDARVEQADDIDRATINLDLALAEIAFATNEHKLIILDVPVDNDLDQHFGVSPGLGKIDAPVGTLVAYGAMGTLSDDAKPLHQGLYPLALANALSKPGLLAERALQEVRLSVAEATGGIQIPWESSALASPLYLNGKPEQPNVERELHDEITFADIDPRSVDLTAWIAAKESQDPRRFERYLGAFPNGIFKQQAERQSESHALRGATRSIQLASSAKAEDRYETLFTQRRVHVKAEPSSDGLIIETIEPGRKIQVVSKVNAGDDWYRLPLADDVDAFIWAAHLGPSPAPDHPDDLAATLPPTKRALLGRWQGEYQCQWDTIGFILDVVDDPEGDDGAIKAMFSFFPLPDAPSFPAGSFRMTGDYMADDGTLLLKGEDWIESPRGFELHDLAGRAEIGGTMIAGRIETAGCTDFVLSRDGNQDLSSVYPASTQ